jgi:hypothetical protein
MVKVKISEFSIDEKNQGYLPELEIKSFIVKTDKDDATFSPESIKGDYMIIMSESEYRNKMNSRAGRKSNPLMINFEEYSE